MKLLLTVLLFAAYFEAIYGSTPAWGYQCVDNKCQKVQLTPENLEKAISLPVCRLYCGDDIGTVWPLPTGDVRKTSNLVHIDPKKIVFKYALNNYDLERFWKVCEKRLKGQSDKKVPEGEQLQDGGKPLTVDLDIESDSIELNHDTDESYKLVIRSENGVTAKIKAKNYYGSRHAIETLAQLVVFDDIRKELLVAVDVVIEDGPKYKHRGFVLDTSRNFVDPASIKRTLEAMAMNKMNVFHWHITDSHSFPIEISNRPELSRLGAYSSREVYTADDVKDIVEYGQARGVRVIPELDAPAHVGEGWQNTDLITCFNAQPWNKYCVEPPCGQFNPSKDELYDYLEDIYGDYHKLFKYSDIFHMGGDEVSFSCWNTSTDLQQWMAGQGWGLEESDFMKLWNYFQTNALDRLNKVMNNRRKPIVLWTSTLTEPPYLDQYLDKNLYIIQIWTKGDDPVVEKLLARGYKMIVSNYDALYLDCGFGGWVTNGNNWCAPYIGWHKIYDNRMEAIGGKYIDQILGAEAALWTEQADALSLDARLWPRVSALAERLWSDPVSDWSAADSRMLVHRDRLVENGILAESIQPKWCLQNEGECPIVK